MNFVPPKLFLQINEKWLWIVFILAEEIKNQALWGGFSMHKSVVCIVVP